LIHADAVDEFHREVVRPHLDAQLVDRHDVRVAQGDRRLGFLDKTLDELMVHGEFIPDLLHDESLLEPACPTERGQEHPRHASDRELLLEDILAEGLRVHMWIYSCP
jgi:hypothetical protein